MVTSRLLLAPALAFLAWLALPGTFVFDDHSLFASPAVAPLDAWRQWAALEQTRPLTYVTFWFDFHLWGPVAAGFRFTNLLIHSFSAALLFLVTRRLFNPAAAAIAAAFFALHPLTHEPLLYVFARSSSLAALFCLAALWFWLREQPVKATAAFALSLLAKEEWVAFPLALLLIDFARQQRPRWLYVSAMLTLSAAAGARVLYATKLIAASGSGFGQQTTPYKYLLLQGGAIPAYLWRILLPVNMSIDPARPSENLLFWPVLVLAVLAASWFWAKSTQPGFWLFPALIVLLPSSSILPAADALAFRRMYLPMAFLAIAAALFLAKWPKLALALLLLFASLAAARRSTWQSERALWAQVVAGHPSTPRPYIQLARLSPPAEALAALDAAKNIAPANPDVASESGRVWLESGNAAQALQEFGRALALAPGQARHLQNRGAALLALGQPEAARADFEAALQRDPCLKPARENLVRLGLAPPPNLCPTTSSAAK